MLQLVKMELILTYFICSVACEFYPQRSIKLSLHLQYYIIIYWLIIVNLSLQR